MKTQESYKLEIHLDEIFDGQPISSEALTDKVKIALTNYLESIKLDIATVTNNDKILYHRIYLEGSLKDIDECHDKLQKANILCQEPLNFYRYIDEAGEQIRYLAYPILAEIEQKIRGFISRAVAEIWGFNWWSSHPPEDIAQRVDRTYTQNNRYSRLHPLECATFEDLIDIFMAKLPSWQNDQILTVNDLSELLNNCDSVEEIKKRLQEKTQERSYWENIFSQYFDDIQEWKQIEKDLAAFILRERNKVMHHRPMRLSMLEVLSKKRDEIIQLIDSAKPELSKEQRAEAQKEAEKILNSHELIKYIDTLELDINRHINSARNALNRSLYEPVTSARNALNRSLYEPVTSARNALNCSLYEPVTSARSSLQKILDTYTINSRNTMYSVIQHGSSPSISPNIMTNFISHSGLYSEPLDYNSEHVEESPEKPELEMEAGEQVNNEINPFLSDQITEKNNTNLDGNIVTDNQDKSDTIHE